MAITNTAKPIDLDLVEAEAIGHEIIRTYREARQPANVGWILQQRLEAIGYRLVKVK